MTRATHGTPMWSLRTQPLAVLYLVPALASYPRGFYPILWVRRYDAYSTRWKLSKVLDHEYVCLTKNLWFSRTMETRNLHKYFCLIQFHPQYLFIWASGLEISLQRFHTRQASHGAKSSGSHPPVFSSIQALTSSTWSWAWKPFHRMST